MSQYDQSPVKEDPRAARSRQALTQALAEEILMTQDLSRVTVTSVTQRAGLTRRTFYSHFTDIADLVDKTEKICLQQMQHHIACIVGTHLEDLYVHIDNLEPCPGSVEFLKYIRQNAQIYQALLGSGGDPAFIEMIKDQTRQTVRKRAEIGLFSAAQGSFFEYYLTFVVSAEAGVLVRWLDQGLKEDPEVIARIMTLLMFVRPGDLYGHPIDFNIPAYGLALMKMKEIAW